MIKYKENIGIFGGSFDPPHRGHLLIAKHSIKRLKLKKLYWLVTNKNPLKEKTFFSLNDRLKKSRKIAKNEKKIFVKFLENRIKSNKTIKTLEYFVKNNKKTNFFLIIGYDNLINFDKGKDWKKILKLCKLVVFSRKGYKKKLKKKEILNSLQDKQVIFVKNFNVKISSSQLRNYYYG